MPLWLYFAIAVPVTTLSLLVVAKWVDIVAKWVDMRAHLRVLRWQFTDADLEVDDPLPNELFRSKAFRTIVGIVLRMRRFRGQFQAWTSRFRKRIGRSQVHQVHQVQTA